MSYTLNSALPPKPITMDRCEACDHTGRVSAGAYLRPEARPTDPEQRTCHLCFGASSPPAQEEPRQSSTSAGHVVSIKYPEPPAEPNGRYRYYWECHKCGTRIDAQARERYTKIPHGQCHICGHFPLGIMRIDTEWITHYEVKVDGDIGWMTEVSRYSRPERLGQRFDRERSVDDKYYTDYGND